MSKETQNRNNIWKWLVLLLLTAASVYFTMPVNDVKDDKGNVVEKGKVRLGLDLKGGSSFVLGVDEPRLREIIIASNPAITNSPDGVDHEIEKLYKAENFDESITTIIRRRVDAMGTNEPVIQSLPKKHQLIVQLPGADAKQTEAAKKNLGEMAVLEFRLTHPEEHTLIQRALAKKVAPEGYERVGGGYRKLPNWAELSKVPGYMARFSSFQCPPGYQFMLDASSHDGVYRPHFVSRDILLTGDKIESARANRSHKLGGGFVVDFTFNPDGAAIFSDVTGRYMAGGEDNDTNEGRCLAIILDGSVVSAPRIQSQISESGFIEGDFTLETAKQLASDLNAGALPAPLMILSESTVAPTVGEDAINSGMWAAVIGFALVAIFMLIYYRRSGIVADIALFLDIVLLPVALVIVANVLGFFAQDPSMGGGGSATLPVLTMPGIAGLVLTLGMAVDANVLIFERIREEFTNGSNVANAIKNGYGRAFTAIFDSNLTTIITGIILFVVGTGPVRGFAIMLTAGVVISMFTAVFVTRLVFEHTADGSSSVPFKMMQFFKSPNFDFLKYGNKALAISATLTVVTLAIFGIRLANNPASVLSVDLTGGTSIVYAMTQDEAKQPSVGDIRKTLDPFDNAAVIQYQRGIGHTTLLVKTGETAESIKNKKDSSGNAIETKDVGGYITKLLAEKFPEANLSAESVEEVGSLVGVDLKKSGRNAVLFSLLAILAYIWFRFKLGFGLGGLVALAHDAFIALGLFSLCGRQVSLIVITALLTIIGYSINDTVVVFDRIRELAKTDKRSNFRDVCNRALNDCLGRTVITSLTTVFAVAALFLFGDGSIYDFALTMIFGIVAGTYSSVFVATPVMLWWYRNARPNFDGEDEDAKAVEKKA